MFFPKIDGFALSISLNEAITDTESEAALIVAKTKTEIVLGHNAYALSQGDAVLALPFTYCRQRTDDIFQGYQIRFPLDALRVFAPLTYLYSTDGGNSFSLSLEKSTCLLSLCEALDTEKLSAIYAIPAAFSVLEQSISPETERKSEIQFPKLLRRALAHIEEQVPQPTDRFQLAERYGVSQSTISRLFRTYMNTTPHKSSHALCRLYDKKLGHVT